MAHGHNSAAYHGSIAREGHAMIPRYQRMLFWILSLAILLMMAFLLHGCEQTREKLTRRRNETPLAAPVAAPSETVRLALADDTSGRIILTERELALPAEETTRAQALLSRLIAEFSEKNSTHPLEGGPAIDDVFFVNLPLRAPASPLGGMAWKSTPAADTSTGGQLAIVNLHGTFADHHPSSITAETLTINSIIGTMYANFPRVQEIRFVVDGHARDTLAGHADLTRAYRVTNTEARAPSPVVNP
jgi:hypothetical protein